MRTYISSALAGAFFIGMATAALAVTGDYDNMCTMGLAHGKDVKNGDCFRRWTRFEASPIASAASRPGRVHGRPYGQSHQGAGPTTRRSIPGRHQTA